MCVCVCVCVCVYNMKKDVNCILNLTLYKKVLYHTATLFLRLLISSLLVGSGNGITCLDICVIYMYKVSYYDKV